VVLAPEAALQQQQQQGCEGVVPHEWRLQVGYTPTASLTPTWFGLGEGRGAHWVWHLLGVQGSGIPHWVWQRCVVGLPGGEWF
jgi:hypothetical protein